jgi:hypothetical protein
MSSDFAGLSWKIFEFCKFQKSLLDTASCFVGFNRLPSNSFNVFEMLTQSGESNPWIPAGELLSFNEASVWDALGVSTFAKTGIIPSGRGYGLVS